MQISLKWVNELVNIETIKLDTLIEKLTLGGFEVEEILEIERNNQKQIILDISATANRSDSLSIHGISTEIAALLDQTVKIPNYTLKNKNWKKSIQDKTQDFSNDYNCSIFVAIIIENLTNRTVPKWITEKLISSGIIPSNDLSDFQNYIILETGYPFQFYDMKKICSKLNNSKFNLSIEKAKMNQKFLASNDILYELDDSIFTVTANEIPISIAGIIETKNFSISESTNTLLIEGSIFNAAKIRQQSRKLGLRTERSARYEKSVRTNNLDNSLYRLISLLRISNPNLTCQLHTVYQLKETLLKPILLKYETINEILGPINSFKNYNFKYIDPKTISSYLTRLNFKFTFNEIKVNWEVRIPKLRSEDITREIDLIEEISRLHGYNNFLTTLPKLNTIGNEDSTYKTRKKITTCFLNLGFTELIHYSLVNQATFLKNEIKLINPLLSDYSSLRTSLLPNLIKTVQENLKQKNLSIEGFEYGHVFYLDPKEKFSEKEFVAGIFGGIKTKLSWTNLEIPITWFEAKGKIEQLFTQLNLLTYWQPNSRVKTEKLLHPYRSSEIYLLDGTNLGSFGQIHPLLANKLNLSSEIYLFEFEIEAINSQLQKNKLTFYNSYSLYPKIIKDLSFVIQRDIKFENIQKVLYFNGTEFLSEINLLDKYQGASIPDHHTSLCLQLVFQSNTKTLENKMIESIMNKLQLILTQKFSAIIRE
jgi:phenylalanyl-tRNA synthetase beta chain